MDCGSRTVQDSLMEAYSKRAQKFGYNHPHWEQTLDSLIAICPNISEAYQEKAFPYLFGADYSKAFALIDKAVELDTVSWIAYRGYLHCIFTKNYEKALADFSEAQKRRPGAHEMDHTYYFYFGLCYLETGRLEEAEQAFLKDIESQKKGDGSNDTHFNSVFYLGMVYYQMHAFDHAEKYFKACLQLYEQFPEANYYLGMVMKVTGNANAKIYFDKAIESMREGYRMNEPHQLYVNYPRQITATEIEASMK